MKFKLWLEIHHSYDNPDWNTKFNPLKKGDTLRVFHGFNDFKDAYRAAIYGLTGREYADRRYSYEADNNPYGLFVTLSLKKAAEFTSAVYDQIIMEFIVKESDLEPPAWAGGSYTVQGGMSQYFGHGRQGKLKRIQRQKDAEKESEDFLKKHPNDFDFLRQSDDKYKAHLLLNSTEYQALFVGDLNLKDILAFHVKNKGSRYDDPFTRLTREEFLRKYKDYKDKPPERNKYNWKYPPEDRTFAPDEEFNGEKFLKEIEKRYSHQSPDEMLPSIWRMITRNQHPKEIFIDTFKNLLWAKQYAKAMIWMKNRYGQEGELPQP